MSIITSISDLKDKQVVIYAAGTTGHQINTLLAQKMKGVMVAAFCDTYKTGFDDITGIKIINPRELMSYPGAIIIIGLSDYLKTQDVEEIEKTLLNEGVSSERILSYSEFLSLFRDFHPAEFEWQQFADDLYNFNTNMDLLESLSKHINNSDKSVVDLGAGNMNLVKFIPTDIEYYPVDFKQRCAKTIVCDFNNDEFPDIYADVYVLCAMLYYIDDPVKLLEKCMKFALKKIIIALNDKDLSIYPEVMHVHGFKNYMFFNEIGALLSEHDFIYSDDVIIESIARRYVVYKKMNTSGT